jgi:hypothetical protein
MLPGATVSDSPPAREQFDLPPQPADRHVKRGEIVQFSQPSPAAVLPSSHSSAAVFMPSPQLDEHEDLPPLFHSLQENPHSIVQALLQPSPDTVLPSSQPSGLLKNPLPQSAVTRSTAAPSSSSSSSTCVMPSSCGAWGCRAAIPRAARPHGGSACRCGRQSGAAPRTSLNSTLSSSGA